MKLEVGAFSVCATEKEINFSKGSQKEFAGEIGPVVDVHQSIHDIDRRQGYEIE